MAKNFGARKSVGLAVASILAAGVPLAVIASPASSLSATCKAWKVTDSQIGVDDNWGKARCSKIGATTKVRAHLNVNNDTDKYSKYFTTLNRTYSTPSMACIWGCRAQYDLAKR